ncbi:cytoplasmic protein [Dacryopinax primogenitus]|uniref:Cytoplasmic protein n=1 Tax=Dacryopinax primogenitus (strain DJM 731) TaxID=1858805 RepID=M5FWX1_DACPD|nr:cytoplasmic protein [Dacryopinax primogenitus]EJT97951.1 cytoplasmic protein [Dacryopinax primogenitus]
MDLYTTSFTYPRHSPTFSPTYLDANVPPAANLPIPQSHVRSQSVEAYPAGPQIAQAPAQGQPPQQATQAGVPSQQTHQTSPRSSLEVGVDAVQRVAMDAMAAHGCLVTFTKADPGKGWNFHLSGGYQQVMASRGMIIREAPLNTRSAIRVPRSELLDSTASLSLKPDVRRRLDEITAVTQAHISVVHSQPSTGPGAVSDVSGGATTWSGLETEKTCDIVMVGPEESVDMARVRILVMLDEISGLHAESCEIDYKLHAIIAGRKRAVIQSIQEETATNIYFPTPYSGVVGSRAASQAFAQVQMGPHGIPVQQSPMTPARVNRNVIWITGEFFGVQRARDMLFQVSMHKVRSVISRDTAMLPRKLDWMLTERMDDLKQIMSDNGAFINFPPVGSQASLISVYGDNRVCIQRTIRSVMQLACQFYIASFWLLPMTFDAMVPSQSINPAQMPAVLKRISNQSGAEIVFKSNCFEMHGLEHEVRAAVQIVLELDIVRNFHHEIRFQIELANDQREFISGKKNGKINKIMKMANVKIKFETFNDHNFLIDVAGSDQGALQGLTMLQEELPAEISFHVPEVYHKRIIGVGGKNIQKIMKKYGVYVKFSNAEEFAQLGGYMDNEDNVVARTPAKNASNLENLKASVMELVNPKDKDYTTETVSIPRRYHRTLLGDKAIFIHDIEQKTNSLVRFPDKETASDIVSIFGPESQVHIAAAMLLEHVPFEADFYVPPSSQLENVAVSADFLAFTERVKRDLHIAIFPPAKPGSGDEVSFKFRCQRSNVDFLPAAREALEAFLVSRHVGVFQADPAQQVGRGDSFADAFAHFDSKLLATPNTNEGDISRPQEGFADRRLRLAASTPDVKALFNQTNFVYNIPENESYPAPGYQPPTHFGSDAHLPPPVGNEYWQAMPSLMGVNPGLHRRFGSIDTPHAGIAQTMRTGDDVVKRGSDSLLEAKLKDYVNKPRSLSNRAQSLDMSSLASISRSGSTTTVRAASPSGSITNSTPPSASTPYFPSVTPTAPGAQLVRSVPRAPVGVDDVTKALGQAQLDPRRS